MNARSLRMVAEAAATRNYLRASITAVYGANLYGVTVAGRQAEMECRAISSGPFYVGDMVVIALINGNAQLPVIIDSVGTHGYGNSPWGPLPPSTQPLWQTQGGNFARTYVTELCAAPANLADDDAWAALLQGLGVYGISFGLAASNDSLLLRCDTRWGASSSRLVSVALDGSGINWQITQTLDDGQLTAAALVHDGYLFINAATASGEGLHKINLSDGSVSWVLHYRYPGLYDQQPYNSLTICAGRLYAQRGWPGAKQLCEIDLSSGALVRVREGADYALGYYFIQHECAISSDGESLFALRQSGSPSQPSSLVLMILDAELVEQHSVEVKPFGEIYASNTGSPKYSDGKVYVGGGSLSNGTAWVRGFDASSGTLLHSYSLDDGVGIGNPPTSQLHFASDHITAIQARNLFDPEQNLYFYILDYNLNLLLRYTLDVPNTSSLFNRFDGSQTSAAGTDYRVAQTRKTFYSNPTGYVPFNVRLTESASGVASTVAVEQALQPYTSALECMLISGRYYFLDNNHKIRRTNP